MAFQKQFKDELSSTLDDRTYWLNNTIFTKKNPGRPRTFSRKKLNKKIGKLQEIASQFFAKKVAKSEFDKCGPSRKKWQVKGHGPKRKKSNFRKWLSEHYPKTKNYVYIFWNGRKCLYVGRTGKSNNRPTNHFTTYWFAHATRVEIIKAASYKDVPKLECLATHHYKPSYSTNTPSTKKWTSRCPLCLIHESIEEELKTIFL